MVPEIAALYLLKSGQKSLNFQLIALLYQIVRVLVKY